MIPKTKTLQDYVISSWLISGATALLASFLLFVLFGLYSYSKDIETAQNELNEKATLVSRRISGELLIFPRGSPEAVALQLQKELNLNEVSYGTPEQISAKSKESHFLYSAVPAPYLEKNYAVLISATKPPILAHFHFSVLLISFILIGLFVGSGLLLQTRYFKKHLIKPIESLVDTSTGEKITCDHWPLELQEISHKLSNSFQQREQIVFNQIARGVIHDIKTILQSLKVASDLAKENPSESRLNNLLKVSNVKLPSLLSIIDTTLDGSREISISTKKSDIVETIKKSITTSQLLPVAQNTSLIFEDTDKNLSLTHDSIQLERVFTNLLKNAYEAIEDKNAENRKIKVSFSLQDKNFIDVNIEDSGHGLPKNPDTIFRLLKSTKAHGSGLGLLISKKIVEAHQGQLIASHSQELNGAKFTVKIPRELHYDA